MDIVEAHLELPWDWKYMSQNPKITIEVKTIRNIKLVFFY